MPRAATESAELRHQSPISASRAPPTSPRGPRATALHLVFARSPASANPPRAGGAHAAAKVSVERGARGPEVPKALGTLALCHLMISDSLNPVSHLTHLGLCLG